MTIQPEAPETEDRSGLSRRTVIKAGAHAAWAIPAVQIITQAPALAASGDHLAFSSGPAGAWNGNSANFTISDATVKVTSGQPTTSTIVTLTITVPTAWGNKTTAPTKVKGWTGPTGSFPTYSYTSAPVTAGNTTASFNGSFAAATRSSGPVSFTADATGFTQAVGTVQA